MSVAATAIVMMMDLFILIRLLINSISFCVLLRQRVAVLCAKLQLFFLICNDYWRYYPSLTQLLGVVGLGDVNFCGKLFGNYGKIAYLCKLK
jgi:hypothetical protein